MSIYYPGCDFCGTCVQCARMNVPEQYAVNLDALESAVLNAAIGAVRSEHLHDATGTPEDEAYNQAITDAIAAIGALLNTLPTSVEGNPA